MNSVLFTNVRILDGTGAPPVAGSVWVEGRRIKAIGRGAAAASASAATDTIIGAIVNTLTASVIAKSNGAGRRSAMVWGVRGYGRAAAEA